MTVILHLACSFPSVTVMVAVPFFNPVTFPFEDTEAIFVFDDFQDAFFFVPCYNNVVGCVCQLSLLQKTEKSVDKVCAV